MQHRQIVLNNHNFNMIEALSDQSYPLDEYFTQLNRVSVEWDPNLPRPSLDTLNSEFQAGMSQINALLMISNPWDIRYQFMVNGIQSITFEDEDGNPLVTMALDQGPTLWYCTCDGTDLVTLASKRSDQYDPLDASGGIQFMMIAPLNTYVHYFTLTVTDHRTNTSSTYKLPPKMYLVSSCNVGTDPQRYFNWSSWLIDGGRYSGPGSCMISPISLIHYGDTDYHENYLGLTVGAPNFTHQSYVPADFCNWGWSNSINDFIINDAEYYIGNIQLPYEVNATGIYFEDYTVQEVGFMNEIDIRYSPRAASKMCGIYVFDEATMLKVAKGVVDFGVRDVLGALLKQANYKDYLVSLNFFHGLKAAVEANVDGSSDIRAADQFLKQGALGDAIRSNSVDTEFVEWKTPVALHINPYFNDYRDYLCSYQIYLPYYGFIDIDPNDAVNADIKIYYNINIVTRMAVMIVTTSNSRTNNLEIKIFDGTTTVGEEVPLNSDVFNTNAVALAQVVGKAFTTAMAIGTGMVNASAALGAGSAAERASLNEAKEVYNSARENGAPSSALRNYSNRVDEAKSAYDQVRQNETETAVKSNAVRNIVSGIPTLPAKAPTRSNGGNSETGTMDELHPYVLITRPVAAEPADYESYVGLPSTESVLLSTCSGFTQVAAVKPETLTNAPKYLNEIIAQLQAGVYL